MPLRLTVDKVLLLTRNGQESNRKTFLVVDFCGEIYYQARKLFVRMESS